MKGLYASLLSILLASAVHGQTLFTYGPYKVGTQEFLNAYRKNNTGEDNAKAREDYLELYTRFKLKVREAYDLHLDTLPNQKADLAGFRRQIEGPYLTDNEELNRMTEEAFVRSQKDIRLSHIHPLSGRFRHQSLRPRHSHRCRHRARQRQGPTGEGPPGQGRGFQQAGP
jgi:peptidyl-prolyl cis-trans isomerase SurA